MKNKGNIPPKEKKGLKSAENKALPNLIVNQINVTPVRRGVLDVEEWRSALRMAESESGWRTKLYDLYHDILLDAHLSSEIEKRVMAITNSELVFINEKGEGVKEINDLIDTPEFEKILTEIVLSKFWGFTLLEFEPGIKRLKVHSIERRNVLPKKGIVVSNTYTQDVGIPYREGAYAQWVVETGEPSNLGILLKAGFWVIIKRGVIGDFAQFSELFGMPTRIAEYDIFDEKTRIELEKAMKEAGSANYILKPKGTNIELLENNTNASGELYERLHNICDKAISILILGQTLTTIDKSGSGFAQATIHQDTLEEILKADKRFIRRVLNNEIKTVLHNLGYPVEGGNFLFHDAIPIAERKEEIELISSLKQLGVPVDDDYVYKTSGIPRPKDYDQLKEEMKTSAWSWLQPEPTSKPSPEPKPDEPKEKKEKNLTWKERMQELVNRVGGFF